MNFNKDRLGVAILTAGMVVTILALSTSFLQELNPYYQSQKVQNRTDSVCADTTLRNPGGLSFTIAVVCYDEHGWHRLNVSRLKDDQYERLIKPLDDRVRELARDKGIYKGRYYD